MTTKYIKFFLEVSLNYTEDFTDLFDNYWVYMWSMVSFFFLQLNALLLSIYKEELARMIENEYFQIIIDFIRLSLPSEFIIYFNIQGLNGILAIFTLIMVYYPFIKILLGIIFNKNMKISSYMIKYFSIFRWALFIPIINIFSFFLQSSTTTFEQFFFILGLLMVLVQSLFIEYIFRNHQFRDSNLAKKNPCGYTFILVIIVFLLIVSNEFDIDKSITVILFHLSMINLFAEYFQCFPVSNSYLSQYYFRLMCIVEADSILLTFFFNSSWNSEDMYFFQFIQLKIMGWYLSGHIQNLWFIRYIIDAQNKTETRFLKFNREQLVREKKLIQSSLIKKKTSLFYVYTEYISLLSEESVRNQHSKMQLILTLTNHKKNCINLKCYCHHHRFYIFKHEYIQKKISSSFEEIKPLTNNQKIKKIAKQTLLDLEDDQMVSQMNIKKFINVLFRETLKFRQNKQYNLRYETLILKHSSYTVRQLDNPPQAYYYLKIQANLNLNPSLHFQVLIGVISVALQKHIIKKQLIYLATEAVEEGNVRIYHDASSHKQISLESILENINYQEKMTIEIKVIINLKIQFWNYYLNAETDKFQKVQDHLVIEIIKIKRIMAEYAYILRKNQSYSMISVRVTQLYHMMVTQDMKEISNNEHKFLEMIRKDRSMPEELLNSLKVLENEVEILITSILNDKGHILNKKTPRMAAFFNYDIDSFKNIFNVKQLMPQFLAQIHDGLMDNYLQRGYSRIIKASDRDVFIMDADNFIRPVKLNLENFFAFNNDFNLIAALMKFKQNKQYIIFDITGKIQGASQQLFQSIKEKSDFIHKKNGNYKNIHQLGSLTSEVFFNELYIFMIIPDIIQRVKKFLNEQRILMEAAGYRDFGESSIMKYFIETGQKNIEIARFQKCELYVPANLQIIIQQYKDIENQKNQNIHRMDTKFTQTINASSNLTLMDEKKNRKNKQIEDNNQFIKGFSMFDTEELKYIDEHMAHHRMVYIFQGACFRYYIRMNLNFTLLAETKYSQKNMAFFVLNVIEKKVPKDMLSHIIMDRLIKKTKPMKLKRKMNIAIQGLKGPLNQEKQQIQKHEVNKEIESSQPMKENENWLIKMLRSENQKVIFCPLQKSLEIQKSLEFNQQNQRSDATQSQRNDLKMMNVKSLSLDKVLNFHIDQEIQQSIISNKLQVQSDNQEQKNSQKIINQPKKTSIWQGLAQKIKERRKLEQQNHTRENQFLKRTSIVFVQNKQDSNSDNLFDEDLTDKSSYGDDNKQQDELFQYRDSENLIKKEDGDSFQFNRVNVGSVIVSQIFQSESLTQGENKFIGLNIALTTIYSAFFIGLIFVLISYQNQYLRLAENACLIMNLQMDYDQIIGSQSLQTINPLMKNYERRVYWANITNQYILNGSLKFKKLIQENQNYLVDLNTIGQYDFFILYTFDNEQNGLSNQKIEFMSLLQIISTALEQINSEDQNRVNSLIIVQKNYILLKNQFDKNFNFTLSSLDKLNETFQLSFNTLIIVLIVTICLILLLSVWANKQYNKYLKFLLLAIVRIKIQEINVEVKRLQSFHQVLSDNLTLWISYDIYQLYFSSELPDNQIEDLSKRDPINTLNQRQEQKHRYRYHMFNFFFFVSCILICFSVYGIFIMNSFVINQNINLKTQSQYQKMEINLSNFVHKLTKQMAQSLLNIDDYLRLTDIQLIQLQQDINQNRINVRQTRNDILFQTVNNHIFTVDICQEIQLDQDLLQSIQTLCQNNLDRGHFSLGINNIITGILETDFKNNLQFMVENVEVELFIWNYYKVSQPYIQIIIKKNQDIINGITIQDSNELIIVLLIGLLVAVMITIVASICIKYFKNQRKGRQLLLSLIPHEKLSQDLTINQLKKIQQN